MIKEKVNNFREDEKGKIRLDKNIYELRYEIIFKYIDIGIILKN